jgi:hypothetical protein
MNKVFIINKANEIRGIDKNKPGTLPAGEYWVVCPQKTEGLLLFTPLKGKGHWLVYHNEWRRGENKGFITSEFRS